MLERVLFFKVTNTGWSKPAYIAACSEDDAKRVAYTLPSNGSLMTAECISLDEIPIGASVNTDILDYQDSKAVANLVVRPTPLSAWELDDFLEVDDLTLDWVEPTPEDLSLIQEGRDHEEFLLISERD